MKSKIARKLALYAVRIVLFVLLFCAGLFVYSVQTWEEPCTPHYTPGIENTCNARGN